MPLTASVESGQSSPSLSTGGGATASVGVGVGAGTDDAAGGATTGFLFSGCGVCDTPVFTELLESEPPLNTAKATPTMMARISTAMPIASPRRRQ